MNRYEQLSHWLAGELAAEEARTVEERLASDPELREAVEQLRSLGSAIAVPPPTRLDDAIVTRHARRPWQLSAAVPWMAAASVLIAVAWMAAGLERAPTRIALGEGTTEVDGDAVLLVGEAEIVVQGRVTVTVEPDPGAERVTPSEEGSMERTTKVLVTGGWLVTVVVAAGEIEHARAAPPSAPAASAPASERRVRELEEENARLRGQIADMEAEWRGTPLPWPEGLPEPLTPSGFERTVRRAVAECAPELEIVRFECSEPPCLTVLRVDDAPPNWWNELVNQCPTWVDAYTSGVASGSGSAVCEDGREEHYQLLGWSLSLADGQDPVPREVTENRSKRFMTRVKAVEESWRCRGE